MAFLRALGLNKAANIYQPKPRVAAYSSAVKGRCVIFAGRTNESKEERLSSTIEVFDQYLEQWRALKTTGSPPKGLCYGACCSTPNGDLYVYGGSDGSDYRGGLYKLVMNSQELEWRQLSAESADPNGPMRKLGCKMVCLDNNKLAVIGGLGIPHGPPQPGSVFIKIEDETDGSGDTNEIHFYDIEGCIWSSPSFSGTRPPPCSEFSLTSIDDHRALLYGGWDNEHCSRVSDVYLIDFQTMVIIKLQRSEGDPWPVERSSHVACCIGFGSKHPQLLVTGGVSKDNMTLKDAWLFDMSSRRWKELPLPEGVLPRVWHSTIAVDLAPGLTEVTVFAGCPQFDHKKTLDDQVKLAETVILSFEFVSHSGGGSCTNEWKLVDVANNSQRGSDERVKGKMEKIKQFAREAARGCAVAEGVSPEDRDEVQRLKDALQETQATNFGVRGQAKELQEQLEAIQVAKIEKEHAVEEAERRREEVIQAARERENELQQIIQRAERERDEAQQLVEEAKMTKQKVDRRMEEAVQTAEREKEQAVIEREVAREAAKREREQAQLNQRRAEEAEAEARELGTQWVVRRREIQLTNVELGRGGWGAVTVANFRGIQVAAKCLYKDLTSAYYRDMFNREMNMAARLRHPNLVQFIGASIEGHPIILTELMKTSLRAELEKENIKQPQVKSISLDVAQALNYLHLMQPHPIIHRDISSANVLLDPLPDNQWKAKVSDYGSVNLQQQLHTENPGSPVYSAPEANSPALQSPKMDIFSVGVLLVEMLSGRFPQVSIRQRLIASIDHAGYLALIQQCLSEERDKRPSAQQLLTALSKI